MPTDSDRQGSSNRYIPMLRSVLAQKWFPELSKKNAGIVMARIIAQNQHLFAQLKALGYEQGKRGYTAPMVEVIDRYLQCNIDFIDTNNLLNN